MNTPFTIYLVDDHQIVIDGLKLLIGNEENIKVVGAANDADTAFREIVAKRPDIALVDLSMPPGMNGLDLIYKLRKAVPHTKFIILSMHSNPREIRDAMNGGAAGYLMKNVGQSMLLKCLASVMQGEHCVPNLSKAKNDAKPMFTPRELEVIRLVLLDHTSLEIAEQLCLSKNTVDVHRKNICRKAEVTTTLGLKKYVDEHRIKL